MVPAQARARRPDILAVRAPERRGLDEARIVGAGQSVEFVRLTVVHGEHTPGREEDLHKVVILEVRDNAYCGRRPGPVCWAPGSDRGHDVPPVRRDLRHKAERVIDPGLARGRRST